MKIKNVLYFINLLKEANDSFSVSDLRSGVKLKQHIEKEKGIVSNNLEKTEDEADAIVKTIKSEKNKLNRKGRTPAQQIAINVKDLEEQSKDVYNLSFEYGVLDAISKLGINTQRVKAGVSKLNLKAAVNRMENAIIRLIGANRSCWEPIKQCLAEHFSDKNHYTLEEMENAGTLGKLIGEKHPLYDYWREIFYTNAPSIGNGELLLSLLLRGGTLKHVGSGDVTFYPDSTSADNLGEPVAVEVKAGGSQLPFDLTSDDKTAALDRIDALIAEIRKYGEIDVNKK